MGLSQNLGARPFPRFALQWDSNRPFTAMRNKIVNAKVTEEEREIIRAKAHAVGETLSNYLRRLALGHNLRPPRSSVDRDLVLQLVRLGNNLNQLTRLAHLRELPDSEALERRLQELRRLLVKTSDLLASSSHD